MKYKNIIFDLDGTLLNTAEGVKEAVVYTTTKLGYRNLTEKELDSFIGPPVQTSLIHHFGCSKTEAQKGADLFRTYYKEKTLLKAVPYLGIFNLMESISGQGINTAVATYKREDYAIRLLKAFHFDEYCKIMHGADNNNLMTKADIIRLCMSELGGTALDSLYIGDTYSDFEGALKCGIDFIGVTYGFGFKSGEEHEFITIDSPLELLNVIK